MAEPATRRATWADLVALPDNVVGELIRGVLYSMPRPRALHQNAGSVVGADEQRAYAVGLESPWTSGRSIVIVSADEPGTMPSLPAMRGFAEAIQTRTDALVLAGERRATFRVLSSYELGTLPPWTEFLWFIAGHWIILMPVLLLTAGLFSWVMKRHLLNVAYRRLTVGQVSAGKK